MLRLLRVRVRQLAGEGCKEVTLLGQTVNSYHYENHRLSDLLARIHDTQRAVGWAFGLDDKPPIKNLIEMARAWSPHRSTAALLFWRYYRAVRNKEGIVV